MMAGLPLHAGVQRQACMFLRNTVVRTAALASAARKSQQVTATTSRLRFSSTHCT